METQSINFSYKKLVSKFRFHGDITEKTDFMWRTSLWLLLFALIIIVATGYLTYEWAMNADETHVPSKIERPTLSLTELESVIGLYQKKQINFTELLRNPPKPPSYKSRGGVSVPVSTVQDTPEALPPDTTPPPPSSPQG